MLHMCRVVVGECDGRPFAPSVQRKMLKKKEGQYFLLFCARWRYAFSVLSLFKFFLLRFYSSPRIWISESKCWVTRRAAADRSFGLFWKSGLCWTFTDPIFLSLSWKKADKAKYFWRDIWFSAFALPRHE